MAHTNIVSNVIALFVRMQAKPCGSQLEKFIIKSWWALQWRVVGGPLVKFWILVGIT